MRINSGRRRRCVAIHGVVACRYSTASMDRRIDMRLGHGIIAHRIQAETARGPSFIAIERHRFMRINASRLNSPSHRCRRAQTTRTIKATCLVRVRRPRPSLVNDSPFGLDVDPLDPRRVYAHKLPDSLASVPPSIERAVLRDIVERAHSSRRHRSPRHIHRVAHRHRQASATRSDRAIDLLRPVYAHKPIARMANA